MKQRVMVIGIRPEYCYPGNMDEWSRSNTLYAANLGACLITNAILRQFNGTYVDDFSNIDRLNTEYDACVLAFATHIHPSRDIWLFTNVVEKLEIPVYFISGGITDYAQDAQADYSLHPSVSRLLDIVSTNTEWIGVRGYHTASILQRAGYKNVVPIGCPTLYWNLDGPIRIEKGGPPSSHVIPYHFTLARELPDWVRGKNILGQDFQDQIVFTDSLKGDTRLLDWLKGQFPRQDEYNEMVRIVSESGTWKSTFAEWFRFIGSHDFVVGPRLHGCIAGLVQKVPALMTTRDLRTREIAEFFNVPSVAYDQLADRTIEELHGAADYDKFNETHEYRLASYLGFLRENGLESMHAEEIRPALRFSAHDLAMQTSVAVESGRKTAPNQNLFSRMARRTYKAITGLMRQLVVSRE